MKKLISEVISMIEKQMKKNSTYLLKIEDFDDPVVYMEICRHFADRHEINFIANLEYSKYQSFCECNNPDWNFALDYLSSNGYVQDIPLTKFRNLAAEKYNGMTLLLLMGAEAALDKGSLKDFSRISMNDVVTRLKKNYGAWFKDIINDLEYDEDKGCNIINNIYKDLFRYINVDPMQLSLFVDDLGRQDITAFRELTEYIYNSLNQYWNIPSILSNYKMPEKNPLKYISNSFQFIHNILNLSSSKRKKLSQQLQKYAEDNCIDMDSEFEGFESYKQFSECLTEFLDNKNIDINRKRFLESDFGIITKIMNLSVDTETKTVSKNSVIPLSGEPLTAYLKMISLSWIRFYEKFEAYPLDTVITVTSVRLSNCTADDEEEEVRSLAAQFENICTYMGGILKYIQEKGLSNTEYSVNYEDGTDPFDTDNIDVIKSKLKTIDKWGKNCEIKFSVNAVGESEHETQKTEFRWSFSPYANWKNSFALLRLLGSSDDDNISAESPLLTTCGNMDELIASESEDEFFIKLESIQCKVMSNYSNVVRTYFKDRCIEEFSLLQSSFSKWSEDISSHGFFNCITDMNEMISYYIDLIKKVTDEYSSYTSNAKSKVGYLLNIFNIISDEDFLESARSPEVIIPAYHPSMLEKISARNDFIIFSFSELIPELFCHKEKSIDQLFQEYDKMATITQAVDVIPYGNDKLICKNVWGYYAVYYGDKKKTYIGNIELVPEECEKNADVSEQSDIIFRNIRDYIKTFPSSTDGLNVAFISPAEIQYVVDGINKVSDWLTKLKVYASVNIKVICFGGSKNISGYLKYWVNNYMNQDRTVNIKTSLQYIPIQNFEKNLNELLENQDMCFIYDILKTNDIEFDSFISKEKEIKAHQSSCQFPMMFIPDTVAKTQGMQRKINISQIQFLVSRSYTQLVNKVLNPNVMDKEYKVMQVIELRKNQNAILDIAHDKCRWVVCEDKAIDRKLLQAEKRRIIGFTTGEGCFGEYNITVSAREDLLLDIKEMLKQKLMGKFTNWSMRRTDTVADYCLTLTDSFDGSRILKALNPYDYETHNFLAYALTVKILGMDKSDNDKYILRSLINLDSYIHWFRNTELRPDYMLIEIPVDKDLYDADKDLNISIKIIECKMTLNTDRFYEEAISQVKSGISFFSQNWKKDNEHINRRYWFTQLYRAIAFSVLNIADNDPYYNIINSKIYNILNGEVNISWSSDIYAFDLGDTSDAVDETEIQSEDIDQIIVYHKYGQLAVQKMLIPEDDGESVKSVDMTPSTESETDETDITESSLSDEAEILSPSVTDEKEKTDDTSSDKVIQENETGEQVVNNEMKRDISNIRILLGTDMKTQEKIYWEFGSHSLNNRHLLVNGNSGSGKTYCLQGLLMSSALQGVSSVVFDYTGGFTEDKLDKVFLDCLGERIRQRVVYVEGIPVNPFKKGMIKAAGKYYPEKDESVANRVAEIFKNVYGFGPQQTSSIYQAVRTCLKKYGENMNFRNVADELEEMRADTVISKILPFIDLEPFVQGEDFSWEQIRDNSEGIVYVIQFDGYNRDIQVLLTEILLWDIWNFCVKTGDESKPFILVMDEAQNLSHKEKSPSAKILTEGRKFGISGWYATQFMKPQLSDDEIQRLQQSVQKLYFCPPDDGVEIVAKSIDITAQGRKEWSEKLKKLRKGECVTCGMMSKHSGMIKYTPKIIKVPSLQERIKNE